MKTQTNEQLISDDSEFVINRRKKKFEESIIDESDFEDEGDLDLHWEDENFSDRRNNGQYNRYAY